MAARPLTYYDNPILRQKGKRVTHFDGSLQKLIDDMVETMHAEHGLGLAAPQVGVSLRLCVIQIPADYYEDDPMAGRLIVLANPEIVKSSDLYEVEEGCLSIPGYVGTVQRYRHVTVKGKDRYGKDVRYRASGMFAHALQHEIDHLNGILYIDHLASPDQLRPVKRGEEEAEEAASSKAMAAGDEAQQSRGYRG